MKVLKVLASAILLSGLTTATLAETPNKIPGATTINSAQAKELFDSNTVFIDVRNSQRYQLGHIPASINLESVQAFNKEALLKHFTTSTPLVIYCDGISCGRSVYATEKAVAWGFANVYFYREGYPGWTQAAYPVEVAKPNSK